MRRPRPQLTEHPSPRGDRGSVPGQQHLGDRVEIERVGLHPPPSLHPPLFGDMPRVQLQHLPPGRPRRRRQQRPVVVAARLHPHLHRHMRARQHATNLTDLRRQRRTRHRELHRPEQPMPRGVGHRQRDRTLADIDRDDDRGRRDWGSMHRHNPTSGECQEEPARQRRIPEGPIRIPSDTSGGVLGRATSIYINRRRRRGRGRARRDGDGTRRNTSRGGHGQSTRTRGSKADWRQRDGGPRCPAPR